MNKQNVFILIKISNIAFVIFIYFVIGYIIGGYLDNFFKYIFLIDNINSSFHLRYSDIINFSSSSFNSLLSMSSTSAWAQTGQFMAAGNAALEMAMAQVGFWQINFMVLMRNNNN